MPEYGRLVQNLVEFAITIPDRDERNRFAESIVRVMAIHKIATYPVFATSFGITLQ